MADKPQGSDDSWWSKLAGFAREVGSITDPEVMYGKMYNQYLSHVNDPQKAAQLAQRGTDLVSSSMSRNKAIWSGLGYMNPVTAPAMIVNQIQEGASAERLPRWAVGPPAGLLQPLRASLTGVMSPRRYPSFHRPLKPILWAWQNLSWRSPVRP